MSYEVCQSALLRLVKPVGAVCVSSILSVRTVIELVTNEAYYANTFSRFIGPTDIAIRSVCRNSTFSELHEIGALCSVLRCNIRSIYPQIDVREDIAIANSIFMPRPHIIANCEISLLWSNTSNETRARIANNFAWSPNHFVPLVSPLAQDDFAAQNRLSPVFVVSSLVMSENTPYS